MLESVVSARGKVLRTNFSATSRVTRATKLTQAASRLCLLFIHPRAPNLISRCLRCLLLVMCTYPFAKKALTLHLSCGEGRERYFGCNLMQRKVLALSHQHVMAEAPVFVSNLHFRVPRLHRIGERVLTGAVRQRKRGHPRDPESRSGLPRRSWPSTFWSRCGPGLDPGFRPRAWHPVAGRCFPCAYREPESPTSPPTSPRSGARHGSMTIETARRADLEFVCVFGHDVLRRVYPARRC